MLDQITPVVLTYNEQANIERTLGALDWAREIVVVDSGSDDATLQIVAGFPNARVLHRPFDDFASQWNRALAEGGLSTPWIMALDADYVLTPELVAELSTLTPDDRTVAYVASFRYCIGGKSLRGSLYPSSPLLFRRGRAHFVLDGHCYRIALDGGDRATLRNPVLHDDRKSFERWLTSQRRYAAEEAEKLSSTRWAELDWPDRVRKVPFLASPLVFAHCLMLKGCVLDGRAGLTYAGQRALAELIISAALVRQQTRRTVSRP